MRFFVATQDYAGLGLAIRLRQEGHDSLLATAPNLAANDGECRRKEERAARAVPTLVGYGRPGTAGDEADQGPGLRWSDAVARQDRELFEPHNEIIRKGKKRAALAHGLWGPDRRAKAAARIKSLPLSRSRRNAWRLAPAAARAETCRRRIADNDWDPPVWFRIAYFAMESSYTGHAVGNGKETPCASTRSCYLELESRLYAHL
jgi:hypothetical protein